MRIEYAKLALDRILEIAEFRFSEARQAQAWMGAVLERAAQLEVFPNMGQRVSPRWGEPGEETPVRRLLFKDVWIVYEVRQVDPKADEEHPDDHIFVLTVRHVREKPDDEDGV